MCKVSLELSANILFERGKKIFYMSVLKVIYRYIDTALIIIELFCQTFEKKEVDINP